MSPYLIVYTIASLFLTSFMLYLTYRTLRIAKRSLLSKILYELLVVVVFLWLHSFAIVFLLIRAPAWQLLYALIYILLPVTSLYFLWDVLRYSKERSLQTGGDNP